ncbi:MAG: T9SS C-terminal target domain-containing protein [Bacteroidetes bacterium]|nr:MAG: T9SS C-terminal target domain-containing protein [Bacteroidota bacterium]
MNGDLIVTGNGEISSVYLNVEGETRIKEYYRLTLKTSIGPKYFNRVVLETGSRFYFQGSSGPNLYFRKPVYASGEFQLEGGNYYFQDSLIFRPQGIMNPKAAKVNMYITKYWRQDGQCPPSPATFYCEGLVEGLVPIQISGVLRIPSGKTLINNSIGGFSITGKLEGTDETSVFVNKTLLAYGPSSDLSPPMDTGVFDITLPGNTVSFNSNASRQEIPAMTYQNILFEKGTPKYLRQGDIHIEGNVGISSFVQKAPTALTLNRVILSGSGDQLILGNGEGTFEGLEVKKPGGRAIASSTFSVGDVLFMTQGVIVADPGVLLLGGSAQILESDSSYVTGQLASQRRISEGSSNNFGGMGIKIKAAATKPIGQLIVIRTTGKSLEPGQIERYFEVIPTNNTDLDATVEFFYHPRDLNGADETDVEVESKVGTGDFLTREAYLYEPDTNRITVQDIDEFGFLSARPKTLAINAFPNPFSEDPLTLQFVLPVAGEARVSIYDTRGALRYEDKFQVEAGKSTLVLTDLPIGPGLYFARVVSGKKDGTHLFVKHNR